MSSPHEKAPAGTEAINKTTRQHDRIPAAGFIALAHLLHASRQLHQLPALPLDAIQGARLLLTRIDADLARLGGAE